MEEDFSFMDFYREVERELELMGSDIDPDMKEVAEMQEEGMDPSEIAIWYTKNK